MRGPSKKYDIEAVLILYASGSSEAEVADKLSIPRPTVNRYVTAAGINRPRHKPVVKVGSGLFRACSRCKVEMPFDLGHFPPRKNGFLGIDTVCRKCLGDSSKTAAFRKTKKIWRDKIRIEILSHYADGRPECACCGESQVEFLTVDHIDGNGNEHRRELKRTGHSFYRWLKSNGFPAGFQILCWNCNHAKHIHGICPHADTRQVARIKNPRTPRL